MSPAQVTQEVLRLRENTQEFDRLANLAASVISNYTGSQTGQGPYTEDKAFKETGNWEGVVKSYRVNAPNIKVETPNFGLAINAGRMALGM